MREPHFSGDEMWPPIPERFQPAHIVGTLRQRQLKGRNEDFPSEPVPADWNV